MLLHEEEAQQLILQFNFCNALMTFTNAFPIATIFSIPGIYMIGIYFKSGKGKKKLTAEYYDDGKRIKTIHFGQAGADDYTLTKDKEQRKRYQDRHRKDLTTSENKKGMGAGALSYYVLWGDSTSRKTNMRSFARRYRFKLLSTPPKKK